MLARFEATTGDVIAAAGANVAKRIGDAVMFVTNAPGVACALALELIEACTRERLPKLRVGLAVGDVIVRQGDFYGRTVNLAARLVERCAGDDLVVADEIFRRAETQDFLRKIPQRAIADQAQFTGFPEPIRIWRIAMPAGQTG